MNTCPRCGTPSVSSEDNHQECPACGFYWNPVVFHHFEPKRVADETPQEIDVLAAYAFG